MAADDFQSVQCSNRDCRIAEGGKCVEGLNPTECPNYGKPLLSTVEPGVSSKEAEPDVVKLSRADQLTTTEAVSLLRRQECRVVALVAPYNAGKTSLIASLYDLFQSGPVGDFRFAGSQTLHAFELICHDSRAASERGTPHTERTARGQVKFYSLSLDNQKTGRRTTLILADRAGEDYRDAGDDVRLAREFVEVSRADAIAVLVDGARLADNLSRHETRTNVRLLVQALVDGGIISQQQRLAVVLTKLDTVRSSVHSDRIEKDLQGELGKIRGMFSDHFASIEVFRVAACPQNADVQRGEGVLDLLNYCLLDSPSLPTMLAEIKQDARVFGRLKEIATE